MDPIKVKRYIHMAMVGIPLIIVGYALDSVILKIIFSDITLYNQFIAKM